MKRSNFKKAQILCDVMDRALGIRKRVEAGGYEAVLTVGGEKIAIEDISALEAINLKIERVNKELESLGAEYEGE